jgi:hypothetical protein
MTWQPENSGPNKHGPRLFLASKTPLIFFVETLGIKE